MRKIFVCVLLSLAALFGNASDENDSSALGSQLGVYKLKADEIDRENKNNVWFSGHENYNIYKSRQSELDVTLEEIKKLKGKRDNDSLAKIDELERKEDFLEKQLDSYAEFKDAPFSGLLKAPDVPAVPSITNPFDLITGFSYITQLKQDLESYNKQTRDLDRLLEKLKEKDTLLEQIIQISSGEAAGVEVEKSKRLILEFEAAYDVALTSAAVYERKINEAIRRTTNEIKDETKHSVSILAIIVVTIFISFLLKLLSKRFMSERGYIFNKVINIINITLIILILLFAYIQNLTYLVAVLGVASAGIAIAMKDMFMNILGWMVVTFGGSFKVGDRVKLQKDGLVYVGDIIDISLMRMTLLEDVTLTTYLENRRAGRVIFIPNNFVFTTLISNYTHETLKTVWDGIYITISFDSNYKKAMYIIKEITKKYSKGYTEIARTQLNQLRQKYNLKNTNVEPKIFSFIEPHGLTIHVWYMTNSYAALALRSTLSGEFIDAINKEDDIMIAYPTQTLNLRQAGKIDPQGTQAEQI
ncbi:MAG: mechanosensitive ion channel [Campylobacteraceae bacterium]|nr:mechanosensitive ion channel [Campylobacteraceae bacterium]